LLDIASTNGTYVNGQRVTESTLRPGDLVRIGGTRLALVGG
jgi:pSer/pThr/pTyr-binding forkhead associated (FHA) protein